MRPIVAPPRPPGLERRPAPTFSVVIPALPSSRDDRRSGRVSARADGATHEVIVCDDGSTDDIEAALAPYRDRIVFLCKENGGAASARNAASRAASGEFVAILDADDVFLPVRFAALGELAAARPDLDVLMTDAYFEAEGRVVGRFTPEAAVALGSGLGISMRLKTALAVLALRAAARRLAARDAGDGHSPLWRWIPDG